MVLLVLKVPKAQLLVLQKAAPWATAAQAVAVTEQAVL